ncbi:hypothetical protein BDW66DRAFT_31187 [Aspergillus desertorum]
MRNENNESCTWKILAQYIFVMRAGPIPTTSSTASCFHFITDRTIAGFTTLFGDIFDGNTFEPLLKLLPVLHGVPSRSAGPRESSTAVTAEASTATDLPHVHNNATSWI